MKAQFLKIGCGIGDPKSLRQKKMGRVIPFWYKKSQNRTTNHPNLKLR